jgi:hypothetical protein
LERQFEGSSLRSSLLIATQLGRYATDKSVEIVYFYQRLGDQK